MLSEKMWNINPCRPRCLWISFQNCKNLSLFDRVLICNSVIEYVGECHKSGFLCLDIKPENIFVIKQKPGFTMFFDFDSFCKVNAVGLGKTLGYSNKWAAPEQVMLGALASISYATDIYILGELLFWSIFERHSRNDERRDSSEFSFKDSIFYDD